MSKFFERIGAKAVKFTFDVQILQVKMQMDSPCFIQVLWTRGINKKAMFYLGRISWNYIYIFVRLTWDQNIEECLAEPQKRRSKFLWSFISWFNSFSKKWLREILIEQGNKLSFSKMILQIILVFRNRNFQCCK